MSPWKCSFLSVLYQQFLLGQWKKVGHLHFFSKDLLLQLLNDTGYEIVDFTYTAGYALPREYGIKDKLLKDSPETVVPPGTGFYRNGVWRIFAAGPGEITWHRECSSIRNTFQETGSGGP